jgi:hypothetical protein
MDDLTAERYKPAESERPKSASALRLLAEIEQRRRILVGKVPEEQTRESETEE